MMQHKMKAVYTIIEGEKLGKPVFRRIGTAFVNRDDSLSVLLDALPANAKLHIRDVEQRHHGQRMIHTTHAAATHEADDE